MKYAIAVVVLIGAFFAGAHSQNAGPTFVTGISSEDAVMMHGEIRIIGGSPEIMVTGGDHTLYVRLAPGYHVEHDKQ